MIKIEQIGLEALDTLQALSVKTYFDTFDGTTSDEDMDAYLASALNHEVLRAELEDPKAWFYFIYYGEQLAGYLKLNTEEAQSEEMPHDWMELQRIYIDREFKGHGLGSTLVEHALSFGREKGLSEIWLGVWEHNYPAQKFYYKFGFERFSEHSFWMGEDEQCDWLLKRRL